MPIKRTFTFQEFCQVLAALRHWQNTFKQCDAAGIRVLFDEHFQDCDPMTAEAIDILCERINFDDKTERPGELDAEKRDQFIRLIADLTKDGEMENFPSDSDQCAEFEMSADDAYETVHSLISEARVLLGMPDRIDHSRE